VRSVAAYGGWASALEILAAVEKRADAAVIGSVLGTRALGLYTIAQRVPEVVVGNVTWNLSVVAFPALARRREEGRLTATTLSLVRYSALFGLPSAAGLAVLAPALVVVLFSATWTDAAAIMTPLSLMFGVTCIVFPLGDTFKALGHQSLMVRVNLVALPVSLGAMVLAAPAGVVAVAWSRVAVAVVVGALWLVVMCRVLDLRLRLVGRELWPGLVTAAGVAGGASAVRVLLPDTSLLALMVGSAAAGAGGLLALRAGAPAIFAEVRALVAGLAARVRRQRTDGDAAAHDVPPSGPPGGEAHAAVSSVGER
jgi:O-antigen/teichoic acid export membrane protein